MSISDEQVAHVAKLAKLALNPAEVPDISAKLSGVLNLIDQMQSIDTQGVVPLINPLDRTQVLRADAVTESNQRDKLQANAPAAEKGLFLVPKVID